MSTRIGVTFRRNGLIALSLVLVLSVAGCAPSAGQVEGTYELSGDPERPNLTWQLRPNGVFRGSMGGKSTSGTWSYEPEGRYGKLKVVTEFATEEYWVTGVGPAISIHVDSDKDIVFHRIGDN